VVLNHVGCLKVPEEAAEVEAAMQVWREGMQVLAELPQVYCKLSMLDYCVPLWWTTPELTEKAKAIVLEVIPIFGPTRCMFATNYPASRVEGHTLQAQYDGLVAMVADMSFEDKKALFHDTAASFYGVSH